MHVSRRDHGRRWRRRARAPLGTCPTRVAPCFDLEGAKVW